MKRIIGIMVLSTILLLGLSAAVFADTEAGSNKNPLDNCEHQWSEWITDTEPDCTTDGQKSRECSICHEKEYEAIPAAHSWSDWSVDYDATCGDAGLKSRYCMNCPETEEQVIPPTGAHIWDSWYTTSAATIFKPGAREHYCIECGTVQKGTIAKLKPFAKFTAKKYKVYKGSTKQMKSVLGLARGDSVKSWKTNKKKVVSITKSGKIKAKKKGTAKITVTLKSGKKATCTIKVVKKPKKKSASSGGSVYITRTGIRYHCDKHCWGLRNASALYKVSLSKAKSKGLTKCHVCY